MVEEEVFKEIPGIKNYKVSNRGRVMRITPYKTTTVGKILKLHLNVDGYPIVGICENGKSKTCRVHRLVCMAFLGLSTKEVNHKDGIKTNNHLSNLEYVTTKENIRHSFATGINWHRGHNHEKSKLTEKDITEIRRQISAGNRMSDIARSFGVHRSSIVNIRNGDNWAWLQTA